MLTWFRIRRRQNRFARIVAANAAALWAVLALNPCFATPVPPPVAMPDCPHAAAMVMPDCDAFAGLKCELPEPFAVNSAAAGAPLDLAAVFIPVTLHTLAVPVRISVQAHAIVPGASPPTGCTVSARLRHCVFQI